MTNDLKSEAIRLAELGYPVFPIMPMGKTPALAGIGCYDGTTDVAKVRQWWGNVPSRNIGIHCEKIVVLDVDQHDKDKPESRQENEWFARLHDGRLKEIENTAVCNTPTGGKHYFFRAPAGVEIKNSSGHVARNVDIRSRGGYVVAAPSRTDDGVYQWAKGFECAPCDLPELPGWLLELIRGPKWNAGATRVSLPGIARLEPADDIERRAAAYLDRMPPSISGAGGHNALYAAALAVTHGFGVQPTRALALLETNFNPRCVPAWSTKELAHKIDDAAGKPHDMPYLWLRNGDDSSRVDVSAILNRPGDIEVDPTVPIDPGPFPPHLLSRPGFIDDVIAYNLAGAIKPQPVLALPGALCTLGTLAGRKVCDQFDTRTNLYCISVAPTTSGKERSRTVANKLFELIGRPEMVMQSIGSYQGLFGALERTPSLLIQPDEFGRQLKAMNTSKEKYLSGQIEALMSLYTSSHTWCKSDLIVDVKNMVRINQPNLCLYATTTPEQLYETITRQNVQEGLWARTMIFEAADVDARNRIDRSPPSPALLNAAREWLEHAGGNLDPVNPEPVVIAHTPDANALRESIQLEITATQKTLVEPYRSIYGRSMEQVNKLALLSAISRGRSGAEITADDVQWAWAVIDYLTKRKCRIAFEWISGSAYDGNVKKIMRIVAAGESKGASTTDIARKSHLCARERDEALRDLLSRGDVIPREVETVGRPATRYYLPAFAPAA